MPILDQLEQKRSVGFRLRPAPANLQPISLIAAALLLLSFFLPWIDTRTGSTSLLSLLMLVVEESSLASLWIGLFVLAIPVGVLLLFYSRLSYRMQNRKLDVLAMAMATYVPMLAGLFYLIVSFFSALSGFFENPRLGLGFVLGVPSAVVLLVDITIQLNRAESESRNNRGVVLWGVVTGLLWLVASALLFGFIGYMESQVRDNPEYLIMGFITFVVLINSGILAITLRIHRRKNLDGILSLDRSIGISLLGALTLGLVSFIFWGIILTDLDDSDGIGFFAVVFVALLIGYGLSALLIGSIVGFFIATPAQLAPLKAEPLEAKAQNDFYEEL